MPICYLFFLLIFIIFVSPILISFAFFYFAKTGFNFLDISTGMAIFVLLAMFFASFLNIPLGKKKLVKVYEKQFFGLAERAVWKSQGVSINVGGAVIPLLIVGLILPNISFYSFFITTSVVTFFSFLGSRIIEERGVVIAMFLPVLLSVFFSVLLAPEQAPQVAFCSGVLGVLIGSDILSLPYFLVKKGGVFSIGGAGIFDAIFLVGIISAILAGV